MRRPAVPSRRRTGPRPLNIIFCLRAMGSSNMYEYIQVSNYVHWGCWTLFFYEATFALSYRPEDLTGIINFLMSIDLVGQNYISKNLEYV